jgi:hypothetical protein
MWLNVWWFFTESVPTMQGGYINGAQDYINTGVNIIAVFFGFMLTLLRENGFIIRAHYTLTLFLILAGIVDNVNHSSIDMDLGNMVILFALCAMSYFRHSVKSHDGRRAILTKLRMDAEFIGRRNLGRVESVPKSNIYTNGVKEGVNGMDS